MGAPEPDLSPAPATPTRRSWTRDARLPAAGIVLLAALLRLFGLDAHGVWLDERFSVGTASGSVLDDAIGAAGFTPADSWRENSASGVVDAVVRQEFGNGLLYQVLLHGWMRVAGVGDFMVRLPSVLAGVLAVLWTCRLARRLLGPLVALWAGLLVAAHPLLVGLSQEARPYSLATALSVLSTLLFVGLLQDGRARPWKGGAYALTSAALVLTHYLAVVVPMAHATLAVLEPAARRRRAGVLTALAAAGVVVTVWMSLGGARGAWS